MGLSLGEVLSRTSYRPSATLALAIQCTLFVWLWGALLVGTLTASWGGILQRLTYATVLRSFGKYSFALYLFHGHFNRLFEKIGFNPYGSVPMAGSVLPLQFLYIVIAISASFAAAYLSWHLFEKHFLRLKTLFPKGGPRNVSPAAVDALPPASIPLGDAPLPSAEAARMPVVPRGDT